LVFSVTPQRRPFTMSRRTLGGLCPLLAAAVAVSFACGEDLALPDSSGASLELSVMSGNGQTGTVGEPLAQPLVIKVLAEGGQPVAGRQVALLPSGDGSGNLDPDTVETNEEGQAVASWTLGTVPGAQSGEARLVTDLETPPRAPFQASAVAGTPDTIRALSPLNQPGRRGEQVESPLVVVAVDRFGNPVAGATVRWAVTVGEGQVSQEQTPTGADGRASVTWELGGRIGVQRVTAFLEGASGSPVTFSATVLF
jgi:Big-like domain-containing protein